MKEQGIKREGMDLSVNIEVNNIPRTIDLVRDLSDTKVLPSGIPVIEIIDQTKLPYAEEHLRITDWREAIEAIKVLRVRGAPAIGIAGAAAVVLSAAEWCEHAAVRPKSPEDVESFFAKVASDAELIATARPTAVNLQHMVDAAMRIVEEERASNTGPEVVVDKLYEFTKELIAADEDANRTMGSLGAELLEAGSRVLTHCNAGSLATAFYGTALGVIYAAAEQGKIERVYADETRPLRQGARLTAFELAKAGVPVTLICDDMAASVMAQGRVDAVFVGADRIAMNGDTANKIGTLGVAIAAARFGIPFYVVAPVSTIDPRAKSGADIPIEERTASEVLDPPIPGVEVYNPAFDVTPAGLIAAIVTERGVVEPEAVASLLEVR